MARVQHGWDPAMDKADQGGAEPAQTCCQSLASDIASYATAIGQLVLLPYWSLEIASATLCRRRCARKSQTVGRSMSGSAQAVNLSLWFHWSTNRWIRGLPLKVTFFFSDSPPVCSDHPKLSPVIHKSLRCSGLAYQRVHKSSLAHEYH